MNITITNKLPDYRSIPLPNYRSVDIDPLSTITLEGETDVAFFTRLGGPGNNLVVLIAEGRVIDTLASNNLPVSNTGTIISKGMVSITNEEELPKELVTEEVNEQSDVIEEVVPDVIEEVVPDVIEEVVEETATDEVVEEVTLVLEPSDYVVSGTRKGNRTFSTPDEVVVSEFTVSPEVDGLTITKEGKVSWTKDVAGGEYLVEASTDKGTYVGIITINK